MSERPPETEAHHHERPHDEDAISTPIGVGVVVGFGVGEALFLTTRSPLWIAAGVAIGAAMGAVLGAAARRG